ADARIRQEGLHDAGGVVLGTVVYDQDFDITVGLVEGRTYGERKEFRHVIGRHDDADERLSHPQFPLRTISGRQTLQIAKRYFPERLLSRFATYRRSRVTSSPNTEPSSRRRSFSDLASYCTAVTRLTVSRRKSSCTSCICSIPGIAVSVRSTRET